ncbi:unnamed protein product, partial [Mesorhabditis spiculigera]
MVISSSTNDVVVQGYAEPDEAGHSRLRVASVAPAKTQSLPNLGANMPGATIETLPSDIDAINRKRHKERRDATKSRPVGKKFVRTAGGQVEEDSANIFRGLFWGRQKYPSFVKAKVVRDGRSNKSKGFGFVSFKSQEDFERAKVQMDGDTFSEIAPLGCWHPGRESEARPHVRSLDILQVIPFTGDLGCLMPIRAKDLLIGCSIAKRNDGQHLFDYLYTRILGWLTGIDKIDKIQIYMSGNIMDGLVAYFIKEFVPQLGWIDQTYKGMDLIIRASDGQALLAVWDEPETCLYLIQCEYNFRRGRCLGSYERNEKSIRRICDLMRIVSDLAASRPDWPAMRRRS